MKRNDVVECLLKIQVIYKKTNRIGGQVVLTVDELEELLIDIRENKNIDIQKIESSQDDLHRYFNKRKIIRPSFVYSLSKMDHNDAFNTVLQLNNPSDKSSNTLAHYMAHYDYKFTIDELLLIQNPPNKNGNTIAHLMAQKGHKFTLDEILQLNNTRDNEGNTISDLMIREGHQFTDDEKKRLGI